MLEIGDVFARLGGRMILRGVELCVAVGEAVALVGPNGAGKTTLCEVVAGVVDPVHGHVLVDGFSIQHSEARLRIGYAPSAAQVPGQLTLLEWTKLLGALKGGTDVESIAKALDAWGLSDCLGLRMSSLSLGQRKRAVLAAAGLGSPRLLVLDEPTVGLDAEGFATLLTWLSAHRAKDGAALIASHDRALCEAAGARVVLLANGRVADQSQRSDRTSDGAARFPPS